MSLGYEAGEYDKRNWVSLRDGRLGRSAGRFRQAEYFFRVERPVCCEGGVGWGFAMLVDGWVFLRSGPMSFRTAV